MSEPSDDMIGRILFSSLLPVARIAARTLRPLRELKRLVEIAYYKEARRRRFKQREITDLMSISMSKTGLLSRQLKERFFEPEAEKALHRRILALLWAGPQSEARLAQFLEDVDPAEIAETLNALLEEKLIREVTGERKVVRYELQVGHYRQRFSDWMSQMDGLNNFMESVSKVIEGRFFAEDERAFVRTLSFRVRPGQLQQLLDLYQNQLFPLVCQLDAEVEAEEESIPVTLSVHWTPDTEVDPD